MKGKLYQQRFSEILKQNPKGAKNMEKWRTTVYAVEMDIYIKHKCPFWQKALFEPLSGLWAEWAPLILPQVRQPPLSQPAHSCSSLCYTTEQAMPKPAVGSTRLSLTGNPALEFQSVLPKMQSGTELSLPSTAPHSVLWHVTAGQGIAKALAFVFHLLCQVHPQDLYYTA